jgi:acid phosphatase class B
MWEYMCGMTAAQIELMSIDKPLTLYGKKKNTPDEEDILEAQERWEKKYGDKKDKSVDAKPLLSNFNIK